MSVFVCLVFAALLQSPKPAALPATAQGTQVGAFIKALNTSEAAFVTFQADNMIPTRTGEQYKRMYARIRNDFGDFKILSVLSASADQISVALKHADGADATFTFEFEKVAPYRISNINVEVK